MKLRFSRALLLALFVAGAYQAEATRFGAGVDYSTINTVTTDTNLTIGTDQNGMNPSSYQAYVKDGAATATITAGGTMNAGFYVREGKVLAGSSTERITINLSPVYNSLQTITTGNSTSLNVGGKDSVMELNNVLLKSTTAGSMVVGSLDGNGSLILNNGTVVDNMANSGVHFIIGAVANGKTNYYNGHVHASNVVNGVVFGIGAKKYSSGTYTTMSDGATTIGAGTVSVNSGSKLLVGTNGLVLGEGSLSIDGAGSAVYAGYNGFDYSGENYVPYSPCGQADEYETTIGALENATSKLTVSDGGTFNTGVGLKIASFNGSEVTIEVTGEGSKLEQTGASKTYIGYAFDFTEDDRSDATGYNYTFTPLAGEKGAAASTTTIEVKNGGTVALNDVLMGNSYGKAKVDVTIDGSSSFSAKTIDMQKGASITNAGDLSVTCMTVGGTVTNNGTINGSVTVDGGTLVNYGTIGNVTAPASDDELAALAAADIVTIATGEVKNYGTIAQDILVEGGALTLGDKASVAGIEMTGGSIDVTGDATMAGALTLTGGSVTFAEGATLTLADGMEVKIDGVTITVHLSDAALAGLLEGTSTFTVFNASFDVLDLDGATMTFVTDTQTVQAKVDHAGAGDVKVEALVPEPTTATLSLLALAALAARRRRR